MNGIRLQEKPAQLCDSIDIGPSQPLIVGEFAAEPPGFHGRPIVAH
jgi:hypothetical protein